MGTERSQSLPVKESTKKTYSPSNLRTNIEMDRFHYSPTSLLPIQQQEKSGTNHDDSIQEIKEKMVPTTSLENMSREELMDVITRMKFDMHYLITKLERSLSRQFALKHQLESIEEENKKMQKYYSALQDKLLFLEEKDTINLDELRGNLLTEKQKELDSLQQKYDQLKREYDKNKSIIETRRGLYSFHKFYFSR